MMWGLVINREFMGWKGIKKGEEASLFEKRRANGGDICEASC